MTFQSKQSRRQRVGWLVQLLSIVAIFAVAGCAPTRNPLPEELASAAQPVGIPNVRAWGGEHSPLFQADLVQSIHQSRRIDPRGMVDDDGYVNILALSGGGADGAFGVGFLNGWSVADTRPKFKLVTGISTGALIAPFAFLGPQYDQKLREAYTTISTKDIASQKSVFSLLVGTDSLADSSPLAHFIRKQVTEEVFAEVAREHNHGRRLYIGTTNLDARRLIVWNMGAIASSGRPGSIELFRKVMLASASIPVAFPPVYIPVEADGATYDEMHVDGGVTTEVFFYGFMLDMDAAIREVGSNEEPRIRIYILRNTQIRGKYETVEPRLMAIASKAVSNLIASQGVGDLYRIYTITKRDGIDFNYIAIPAEFEPQGKEAFDPHEMKRLFDLGFNLARSGYEWQKQPPGMSEWR